MGAGFALFVAAEEAARGADRPGSWVSARSLAGAVREGSKRLTIEPLSLQFDADDLQLR